MLNRFQPTIISGASAGRHLEFGIDERSFLGELAGVSIRRAAFVFTSSFIGRVTIQNDAVGVSGRRFPRIESGVKGQSSSWVVFVSLWLFALREATRNAALCISP